MPCPIQPPEERLPDSLQDQALQSPLTIAPCRGKSKPDFIAKLAIVEEEADESQFWLELIIESEMLKPTLIEPLKQEASEIVAIMVSSRKSASKMK